MGDTIFALSSGQPPAGIAIIRVSGPAATEALRQIAGRVPKPRRASVMDLRAGDDLLDRALVLFFAAPGSATGEDVAELHLHGGKAVVAAVLEALSGVEGLRLAEAGEFTRRALDNGRVDLTEAEGLADLLQAETASQRRAALLLSGGALGRVIADWNSRVLKLAAEVEALLDFSDEGDVDESLPVGWRHERMTLAQEMSDWLAHPTAERLRDGVRVVIAGPPNVGKSTLLNALVGREAAITSDVPGTTRDLIDVPVAIGGIPFLLTDSAGLRASEDAVEVIGVQRAQVAMQEADLILWLGEPSKRPPLPAVTVIHPKCDQGLPASDVDLVVSAFRGDGIAQLVQHLKERAAQLLPREGEVALNGRHRREILAAIEALKEAGEEHDLLIVAENLRRARVSLDRITGRSGVEEMLDTLFARFCVGK